MTSGLLRGIEEGWFTGQIAEAAYAYQADLERGAKKIVGVNCHTATITGPLEILRVPPEVEHAQVADLAVRRAGRDQGAVDRAIAELTRVAQGSGNLIEPMLTAARAEATLGEICDALRGRLGRVHRTSGLLIGSRALAPLR